MARRVVRTVVVRSEIVHAAPASGLSFCPCCDKTPMDFDVRDRIAREPGEVNCGRFSASDERLLAKSSGS